MSSADRASLPRLSILLPTTLKWPGIRESLESLLKQDCGDSCEILVLDGHGAALAQVPDPRVRWIRAPGADVFELRAQGIALVRGEIIAITEDHCLMPRDWCRQILAAHEANSVAALIGPVSNHADTARRAVDRANFLLTFGPYASPVETLTADRLPVPTNFSIKRSALRCSSPASGWLEYDLLSELKETRQIGVASDVCLEHRQRWGILVAPIIHFASGRSYGASTRVWPPVQRRQWFRDLPRLPGRLLKITRPALERGAGGAAPNISDRFWLRALVLANTVGQFVGALIGPGSSRRLL